MRGGHQCGGDDSSTTLGRVAVFVDQGVEKSAGETTAIDVPPTCSQWFTSVLMTVCPGNARLGVDFGSPHLSVWEKRVGCGTKERMGP